MSDLVYPVLWAITAAFITYTISHFIAEFIKWQWAGMRLRGALVVESIATVNKMESIAQDIANTIRDVPLNTQVLTKDQIRLISAGYVTSSPTAELSGLISLGTQKEAKLVIDFLDRWARFREYESRFAKAHEQLLESADDRKDRELSVAEYSDQVLGMLGKLRRITAELMYLSMKNIRHLRLNKLTDDQLYELSGCRWASWREFESDQKRWLDVVDEAVDHAPHQIDV